MSKKYSILYIIFIIILAFIIPNLTIASTDTTTVVNITENVNAFTLNFSSDKQLIPGTTQSKSFIINNQHNFSIELDTIALSNLSLYKDGQLLSSTDVAYDEFVNNAEFKLLYQGTIVFKGSFISLFTTNSTFVPNKKLIFLKDTGDEFSANISLSPQANNTTQNMTATFDISYSFVSYNHHTPEKEPPSSIPDKKQSYITPQPIVPEEKSEDESKEKSKDENVQEEEKLITIDPEQIPKSKPLLESDKENIIIDDEIPKMGVFFDNYTIIGIGIIIFGIGIYLIFFSKKKSRL